MDKAPGCNPVARTGDGGSNPSLSTVGPDVLPEMRELFPSWLTAPMPPILVGVRGSHAHGTYIPPDDEYGTDDVDLFAVGVQPVDWYLGLGSMGKQRTHFETKGETLDVLAYDIRKFGALLVKGNPNVHMWLWAPADCYLDVLPAGQLLLDNREAFLSQRLLDATAGYAAGQLHKMERFERKGYMGAKRKALVERHNYDTKNGAHCIRLLVMGMTLACCGEVEVRPDRQWSATIMGIKRGEWSLERVKGLAEHLFDGFNGARKTRSELPPKPNEARCNDLIIEAIRMSQPWEGAR